MGATTTQAQPISELDRIIDQVTLFDGMSTGERAMLQSIMEPRTIGKYTYIYHQDDQAEYVYLLAEGTVKIGTQHNDGREMIKRILHPEAVFGEIGLFSNDRHNSFAMTLNTEVRVYRVSVSSFRQLMRQSAQLNFNVLEMIGRRLTNTEKRLESLIFKDARARIIDFLRFNAETRGRKVGFETFFKHNLTQQDIANFTGTSRQTVTSVLNELRKSNLIYFNRTGILIRDLANLE
ncbi:MAG: Crp/Fnr family transcriptional regulator [Saprospiraceae bacterium]|nr:Crp/Fnr family transcriptional regulator [Saprospiraceae bacterium]